MSLKIDSIGENTSITQDDQAVIDAGYQPKLQRSLGLFSSFAVSFSFISITTGIFANYGYALSKAGPFGIWTWLLVAMGQTLVALVYAEMAGRMPLAGCAYNWNTKLSGSAVGWFTGWMILSTFSVGTAAVTVTAVPLLGTLFGVVLSPLLTRCLAVGILITLALINIYGVRLTSKVNVLAVYSEIISILVMGCLVVVTAFHAHHLDLALITTIPSQPRPYWQGFLMAFLMGSWGIIGFETSADMSEETINAHAVAPKGVISSVVAASLLGMLFLIELTISIPDVATITAADNPLIAIVTYHLGQELTNIFLIFVVIAILSCALICVTATSRVLFALARDGRFIAPDFFQKVSAHHVPTMATCFVTLVAAIFAMMADSLVTLFAATAIMPALVYLITVVSFAVGSDKLPVKSTFSLGRWHRPVVTLAILWLIGEIGILTIPEEFHSAAYATAGVMTMGIIIYATAGRKFKPGRLRD